MSIDEAIKFLEADISIPCGEQERYLRMAEKLGIEALKGIKKVRKALEPYVTALLPGETEK